MRLFQSSGLFSARQAEQDAQVRRVIGGVGLDIPVVETVIDRFHRECVALFARRERVGGRVALTIRGGRDGPRGFQFTIALALLGDIAHRADDAIGASVGMAHRDASTGGTSASFHPPT